MISKVVEIIDFILLIFFSTNIILLTGGDVDAASKTLLGVCKTSSGFYFLIAVSPCSSLNQDQLL